MNKAQKSKNGNQKPFAKKSLGQNFLVDPNYIEKIISELKPQNDETIIEIGAGRGALTRRLVEKAGRVIAVELDKDLIPILQTEFAARQNFTLVEADALAINFAEVLKAEKLEKKIKLVGNLPYYISTAILQRLIEQREHFSELVLMLQREVVERITAPAGSHERGYLTVIIEAVAETEKIFNVPPTAFRPAPKVWSSVVKINFKDTLLLNNSSDIYETFKKIVSAGFMQKRKTILNNLKKSSTHLKKKIDEKGGAEKVLEQAGINTLLRAESLSIEQWTKITALVTS